MDDYFTLLLLVACSTTVGFKISDLFHVKTDSSLFPIPEHSKTERTRQRNKLKLAKFSHVKMGGPVTTTGLKKD